MRSKPVDKAIENIHDQETTGDGSIGEYNPIEHSADDRTWADHEVGHVETVFTIDQWR